MSSVSGKLFRSVGLALLAAGAVQAARPKPTQPPVAQAISPQSARAVSSGVTEQRALLDKYCLGCHSDRLKTAGLSLASLDLSHIGERAEMWEKVGAKLRTKTMPPAHMPQPDPAASAAFVSWLDGELDAAAAAAPNPGRGSIHRLNRPEYANAIRDLLALEIDVQAMLPVDESGHGFDNIADILTFSPGLLERYMIAAQKISRVAVGDPTIRPSTETYKVSIYLPQDANMGDDLPFGSRGGTAVRHYFPQDGEYRIKIGLRRAISHSEIYGLRRREQLDVLMDGVRVARFAIGGDCVDSKEPKCIRPVGGNRPTTEYERTADAGLEVRLPVKAGQRSVAVTFLQRPGTGAALEGEMLTRMPLTFDVFDNHLDEMSVENVQIYGPLQSNGGDTPSRRQIFVCQPANAAAEEGCAKTILTKLARRAYRRPVNGQDVEALLAFYRTGRKDSGFEAGVQLALEALLVQPEFLFRMERDPADTVPGQAYRLSDLELASRLSFFLWSSIPDDELLQAAEKGTLRDPKVLDRQVRRMLADARSSTLVANFAGQWLWLRNMRGVSPDPAVFPDFDDAVRTGLQRETELFLESQIRDDRSAVDLLTANYTFLNERLAKFYGVPNVYGNYFRRVTLNDGRRAGLLGQGSVLTVTSYSTRTSPVIRGRWLLENILGAPPPPPPPNVPALKENGQGHEVPTSVRARLEEHRRNPACASCHARMDPLGFALENFDGIGKWRDLDAGSAVNATGTLPDGTPFNGPAEFRAALVKNQDAFTTTVAEKLLTYALGRGVEYYDKPAIRRITRDAAASNYRWSSLVLNIVQSMPFQMRRAAP